MKLTRLCQTLAMVMATFAANAKTIETFSGINQVSFHDSQYNKAFAGNGFLITHKNKTYAVTVKHALLEAKTPEMNAVSIDGFVSQWKIHPNQQPDKAILLGKMLNSDNKEKLDMAILQKDWLVFEVQDNQSELQVIKLRQSPLEQGETLTAYGCSYANAESCEQDVYRGTLLQEEANNLRIAMPDLEMGKLRGLSGSPVLDEQQRLVGIVSNVLPSKSGQGFDFAPANLVYLKQVLETL